MTSAICTLFEGDYHLGLAALANSLHAHGYRGVIWAGTRGALPAWATPSKKTSDWDEFSAAPELTIRFIQLTTKAHLTNYKPEFLLDLMERLCPEASQLFYFDPDIVVKCRWSFFEEWAGYGIALVEDVNSPMPEHHPRRAAWKKYLAACGRQLRRETPFYVNGGFTGISRNDIPFLRDWKDAMSLIATEIGGLEHSMFSFANGRPDLQSPAYPYSKTDQDALNIAVMISAVQVSIMGAEGMDFRPGGWTMSHALGPEKPWRKRYIRDALRGLAPSMTDREFWQHAEKPIAFLPDKIVSSRRRALKLAVAINRFIRRS
jgi:hypothetical protein